MKNIILSLLIFVTGGFSMAATSKTLICKMGGIADMDIVISNQGKGRESVEVILYAMDGDTKYSYKNSSYVRSSVTKALAKGKFKAIVSKSELQDNFGGAFLQAGMLEMKKMSNGRFDVLFAAQDTVFTANCGE